MRGAASASAHTSSAASSTWSTIPHSRTPPLHSNIEKVGDIVRPSSATALLSSVSTSSSGIEAGTSCASTPTTANTLPPLTEESLIEDETGGEGVVVDNLVKSSIKVPSPSDTPRVTPANADETAANVKKKEENIEEATDDVKDREVIENVSKREAIVEDACSQSNSIKSFVDEPSTSENGPTHDGVLPSTSSAVPEVASSSVEMTSSLSTRNPLRKIRYSLRLPAKAAQRLKRIANFQPGSLRRIGLSALKISDGDLVRLADGPPPQIPVAPEIHTEHRGAYMPSTSQNPPRELTSLSHQLPMLAPQQAPPPQVPPHMVQNHPGNPGHINYQGHSMVVQQLPPPHHQGHPTFQQVMVKQEPPSQYTPHPQQQPPPLQQQQMPPQYPPVAQAHPHQMHPGMRQMTAEEFAQLRSREGFMGAQIKQELPSGSGQPTPISETPQQMTPQQVPMGQMIQSQGPPGAQQQQIGHPPINPQQQRIQQPNASNSPLLVNLLSNQQPPQQTQQQYMQQYPGQPAHGLSMQQIAALQQQQQQAAAAQHQQQYQQRMIQQQQQQAMMQQQQAQNQQQSQQQGPPPTTPTPGQQQIPPGYYPGQQAPPGTPGRQMPAYAMGQPPMYHPGGPQPLQRIPSYSGNAGPAQQFRPPPQQQQSQPQQQLPAQDPVIAEPPKKKKRPTKKQKEAAAQAALEQQQQQQQMQAYYGQQQQQQERMQMMQQQQQQQGQMMQPQQNFQGQAYPGGPPQGPYPPGYHPAGPPPTQQQQQMWHQQMQQQQRMALFQQQQQAQAQGQQQPGGSQQPMGQWPPQQRPPPVPYPPGTNQMPSDPNQPGPSTAHHRLSGEFAPPPGSSGEGLQQKQYHPQQQKQTSFHRSDSSASFHSGSQTPFGQNAPPGSQAGAVQGSSSCAPQDQQQPKAQTIGEIGEKAIVDQLLNSSEPLADLGDLGDLGDLDIDPIIEELQEGQHPSTSNGENSERNDRHAASIELVVDEVARSGRGGANSADLARLAERRESHSIQLPVSSPGGTPCVTGNLSHEHNMRAHAFHGANRMVEPNGVSSGAPRMVNGHEQKTNGARRQQQPHQQPGGMMHQTMKGEEDTNDAKIAEFAKTISEKDKKIKAAAESKTKLQAKATRKPRTTKKAANAAAQIPGIPSQQQQQQHMPLQHPQMQAQQHPNVQMMMQHSGGHPGHMQMHPQMQMHMQMHPQHHEEMMMQQHHHQQQQQQLQQMPLHHLPLPQQHQNVGLPPQQVHTPQVQSQPQT